MEFYPIDYRFSKNLYLMAVKIPAIQVITASNATLATMITALNEALTTALADSNTTVLGNPVIYHDGTNHVGYFSVQTLVTPS